MEMEHKYHLTTPETDHFDEQPENDDDALSLCDLPLHQGGENDVFEKEEEEDHHDPISQLDISSTLSDPDDHVNFEFSTTRSTTLHDLDADILFFGKSIPGGKNSQTTSSFGYNDLHQKPTSRFQLSNSAIPPTPRRSSSVRLPDTGKYRSPTSGISRIGMQYNVLIGVAAKFDPPRMELSEMRKRQSRRAPSPMFSGFGGEQPVVAGGKGAAPGKGHGNLLRALRFRSNLASALTKVSFGCIRQCVLRLFFGTFSLGMVM